MRIIEDGPSLRTRHTCAHVTTAVDAVESASGPAQIGGDSEWVLREWVIAPVPHGVVIADARYRCVQPFRGKLHAVVAKLVIPVSNDDMAIRLINGVGDLVGRAVRDHLCRSVLEGLRRVIAPLTANESISDEGYAVVICGKTGCLRHDVSQRWGLSP